MPGTTSRGFRYPLDSDPFNDGAEATRNLANDVNSKVGAIATGVTTVSITASSNGSVAIAFPAGRFSAAPNVVVGLASAPSGKLIPRVGNITTAGATVFCFTGDGSSVTSTAVVHWIAIQQ